MRPWDTNLSAPKVASAQVGFGTLASSLCGCQKGPRPILDKIKESIPGDNYLDPKKVFRKNSVPKSLERHNKAIILHTCGVQVSAWRGGALQSWRFGSFKMQLCLFRGPRIWGSC